MRRGRTCPSLHSTQPHVGTPGLQCPKAEGVGWAEGAGAEFLTGDEHGGRPGEQLGGQVIGARSFDSCPAELSADTVEGLRAANPLEQVEVTDLGLEDIFKDYVRGWRASA